jgi:hypothetical protein
MWVISVFGISHEFGNVNEKGPSSAFCSVTEERGLNFHEL